MVDAPRLHCPACGAEVSIVSPENAAEMIDATAADVHQLLTTGELHAVDESPGIPLICANSVSAVSPDDENEI